LSAVLAAIATKTADVSTTPPSSTAAIPGQVTKYPDFGAGVAVVDVEVGERADVEVGERADVEVGERADEEVGERADEEVAGICGICGKRGIRGFEGRGRHD
jgi:hypothetical protein